MGMVKKGYFITLEGIEGAGKSTHIGIFAEQLRGAGHDVVLTREPGGTALGERIRALLLDKKEMAMSADAELLLLCAARAQHAQQVLMPQLAAGRTVVCDRFTDSSIAYQGGGRGIEMHRIKILETWVFSGVLADLKPDLTLLFDVPVEVGLARAGQTGDGDRFETETVKFFQHIRDTFLEIAAREPDRVCIIDAERDKKMVRSSIMQILKARHLL